MEGNTLEEIDESLEVKRFKKSIRLFQEKLSAYRIIGYFFFFFFTTYRQV